MRARCVGALVLVFALVVATSGCATDTPVFRIEVGTCVTDVTRLEGPVQDLPTGPCDEPHDAEVVGVFEHADAVTLPATLEADSTAGCAARFEEYLGIPPTVSSLGLALIDPTAESWAAGDRGTVCLATVGEGEQDISRAVAGEGEEFIGVHTDDPTFEPQAIDCMTGGLAACDALYEAAPSGSTEELIGLTCGGRIESDEVDEPGRCEQSVGGG